MHENMQASEQVTQA